MLRVNGQGIFYQYRWLFSIVHWLVDSFIVVSLLAITCKFYAVPFLEEFLYLGIITFILTVMVFHGAKLYRPWRGVNLMRLVERIFLAWALVVVMLVILGYIAKTSGIYSRRVLITWFLLTPLALVVFRLQSNMWLRWARSKGRNSRTVVIAGAGNLGKRLAANVVETISLGMNLLGFFDDRLAGEQIEIYPGSKNYHVLGDLDDMVVFVQKRQVNMVYLALPMRAEARLLEVIEKLKDTTASVYFAPDIFIFLLLRASLTELRGIPLISLWETPFYGINGWLKRAEDIILTVSILLIIWPLLVAIALGVKLSSPGPIFFRQRRYGLDGQEILVYKFRTMKVCEDGPVIPQAIKDDPRVTPLGKFLRQTSLDELPQLFNVLRGTMSMVGPRPHAVAHNEYFRQRIPGYMLRHKVRPGLSGWAQINGCRGETDTLEKMERRIKYDLDYLRHWSLWLDLKIVFITILKGFKGSQAY